MATEDYGRLKLLFVDDSPHTRTLLREILHGSDWPRAVIVDSAAAAFASIKSDMPDLVITDWEMPGRSGIDLINDIREDPELPDPLLAVILLTGNDDAAHVMKALDAGATGFLVKPISMRRIRDGVVNAVTRQRPFIISPGYKGPERRGAGRVSDDIAGTLVLPPDNLLVAKIRGEPAGILAAWKRRVTAIDIVRRFGSPRDAPVGVKQS